MDIEEKITRNQSSQQFLSVRGIAGYLGLGGEDAHREATIDHSGWQMNKKLSIAPEGGTTITGSIPEGEEGFFISRVERAPNNENSV